MAKKSLGQNFLKDENILSNIVDSGNLVKGDTVLEIGPGTGNLTKKLIEKEPDKILVVEKDKELSELLKKKINYFYSKNTFPFCNKKNF